MFLHPFFLLLPSPLFFSVTSGLSNGAASVFKSSVGSWQGVIIRPVYVGQPCWKRGLEAGERALFTDSACLHS